MKTEAYQGVVAEREGLSAKMTLFMQGNDLGEHHWSSLYHYPASLRKQRGTPSPPRRPRRTPGRLGPYPTCPGQSDGPGNCVEQAIQDSNRCARSAPGVAVPDRRHLEAGDADLSYALLQPSQVGLHGLGLRQHGAA